MLQKSQLEKIALYVFRDLPFTHVSFKMKKVTFLITCPTTHRFPVIKQLASSINTETKWSNEEKRKFIESSIALISYGLLAIKQRPNLTNN